MNPIDQVKLIALQYAMETGLRYNDALWITLNQPSSVYVICDEILKTPAEAEEMEKFSVAFDDEYLDYHQKMLVANMYPDWQLAKIIQSAPMAYMTFMEPGNPT